MLICVSALALAVGGNFVNTDFIVPTRDGQKVGTVWRRREREAGDGVGGRVGKRNILLEVADACRRRARGAAKESRHDYR